MPRGGPSRPLELPISCATVRTFSSRLATRYPTGHIDPCAIFRRSKDPYRIVRRLMPHQFYRGCLTCGERIPPRARRDSKYCDPRCRVQAHRAKVPRLCRHCGQPRPASASRWCSNRCKRAAAVWRAGKRHIEVRPCRAPGCPSEGAPTTRHSNAVISRGWLSRECAACGQLEEYETPQCEFSYHPTAPGR